MRYTENPRLAVIGYIHSYWYTGLTSQVTRLTHLEPKLFLEQEEFFKKTVAFINGDLPNARFNQTELDRMIEFTELIIPESAVEGLLIELKRDYIRWKTKNTKVENEDDMMAIMKEIYSLNMFEEDGNISEIVNEVYEARCEGKFRGIDTGVKQIDDCTVGFREGHVWGIGAQYGTGKTQIALEMINRVAKDNLVYLYSLEMTKKDLIDRIIWINQNGIGGDYSSSLGAAMDYVKTLKLEIFTDKVKLDQIETHILSKQIKPKVIFIDYVQQIRTNDKDEYNRLTAVAQGLQSLALKANICIVFLSQLGNQSINSKTQTIGFKGSGALPAVCDVAIEMKKEKLEDPTNDGIVDVNFDVSKNRHGRSALFKIAYDSKHNKFLI